jgi:hypothetical protein
MFGGVRKETTPAGTARVLPLACRLGVPNDWNVESKP